MADLEERIIALIGVDCFFCKETRKHPELKTKQDKHGAEEVIELGNSSGSSLFVVYKNKQNLREEIGEDLNNQWN